MPAFQYVAVLALAASTTLAAPHRYSYDSDSYEQPSSYDSDSQIQPGGYPYARTPAAPPTPYYPDSYIQQPTRPKMTKTRKPRKGSEYGNGGFDDDNDSGSIRKNRKGSAYGNGGFNGGNGSGRIDGAASATTSSTTTAAAPTPTPSVYYFNPTSKISDLDNQVQRYLDNLNQAIQALQNGVTSPVQCAKLQSAVRDTQSSLNNLQSQYNALDGLNNPAPPTQQQQAEDTFQQHFSSASTQIQKAQSQLDGAGCSGAAPATPSLLPPIPSTELQADAAVDSVQSQLKSANGAIYGHCAALQQGYVHAVAVFQGWTGSIAAMSPYPQSDVDALYAALQGVQAALTNAGCPVLPVPQAAPSASSTNLPSTCAQLQPLVNGNTPLAANAKAYMVKLGCAPAAAAAAGGGSTPSGNCAQLQSLIASGRFSSAMAAQVAKNCPS